MRFLAICVLFAFCGRSAAADLSDREPFEVAVDRGLEYLANAQGANGSWSTRRGNDPAAVNALCVMAFMSAGHVPGEGPYGKVVERGIQFVLDLQQPNGLFSGAQNPYEMYHHGICTLMISEAVGMIPDRRAAKRLRDKLELAVGIILKAQLKAGEDRGGWRYTVTASDADISVTGWQLMALRAARNVGCDIPAEPIERAVEYITRCYDSTTGGYRYQRNSGVTVPCTGTAMLALELTGKEHHGSAESLKAGSFVLKTPLSPLQKSFFYGVYYTSQAMFQLGDNYWTVYRKSLHDMLLRQNVQKTAGCWTGWIADDLEYGPNYCTAMGILALTVEYRFLPIYQRNEEPAEKEPRTK